MPQPFAINPDTASCAHCGLPVFFARETETEVLYCCNACRLVASIVGNKQEGELAWTVLRLAVGALLAMNVMMISLMLYTGETEPATVPFFRMVLLALSTAALAVLLYPFVAGAYGEFRRGRMSIDTLIAGGALAAYLVSAANTVRGEGHIYFDTATMLPVLVTFGKLIESAAKSRSAALIRALEGLLPPSALRVHGNRTVEVPAAELRQGDTIRIRPGARIAADGTIVDGTTLITESAFTGETDSRCCGPGDRVLAGTVNGSGSLLVTVTGSGPETLLAQVVAITDAALRNRAPSERLAEKAAHLFVPAVLLVALCSGIYWILAGEPATAGLSVLAVLVVACPCTMGIATPLATSVAIARAARAGVVVRGGDSMELVGRTDLVLFDKTGTVTESLPRLHDIVVTDPVTTEEEFLGRLAPLEEASEHPVARAITEAAYERGIEPGVASAVRVVAGYGIRGTVCRGGGEQEVIAGTATFAGAGETASSAADGFSELWVSWGGRTRGRVRWSTRPRPEARETVAALHRYGIETCLLSGDNSGATAAVGAQLGIDRLEASCTPAGKARFVASAVAAGRTVMMVGDGINDGPALAAASVGVAVGGIELARQSGNIILLSEGLLKIPWLIRLSKKARTVICQNFAWSFAYNGVAIAAAAAGMLHPLMAAVAMAVSSLTVTANSLRLHRFP